MEKRNQFIMIFLEKHQLSLKSKVQLNLTGLSKSKQNQVSPTTNRQKVESLLLKRKTLISNRNCSEKENEQRVA